ncbi:MAG: YraN family protein [Patescibacteria group bacterium]|jgi:putative endonuclease
MPNDKTKLGQLGEKLAAKYLKRSGYQILKANYRRREGEIDLICRKNNLIIFVEVKTRTGTGFGWPEEAVTESKIEKIEQSARHYLQDNNLNLPWQIDVISLIVSPQNKIIDLRHFQNT